jgi:hypothetical protein
MVDQMLILQEFEAQKLNFIRKRHLDRAEILEQAAATIWVEYVVVLDQCLEHMVAHLEEVRVEEIYY